MNGNVKSVLDKTIFASSNPMLVFQDLVITDNISRYLKEKYITFSINCDESFSNVEDVIGNDNDAPIWYMKLCEISKKHDHKYSAGWYKRLYEISQKHSQEKVLVIFENFEKLDDTIGKVFFDYVIGDKKLEFPENVKIILNSDNSYYNKIYSKFSDYCDLVRIRGEDKIFCLPLEAKQNDKKLVSSKILDGEIIKSSQLLVNSVDIDPKVKNAIDHVLHNQSALIYITNRTNAPCFEYLRSIYKSVVLESETLNYYPGYNQIVRSTPKDEFTIYNIRKEFPFLDKIPKFEYILNAPIWYSELCKKCSEYPNEKILMIFNNIECLNSMYYDDLAKATLPNYSVWQNWILPKNAQLVFIENNNAEYYYSYYDFIDYDYSNNHLIKNHCSNVLIDGRGIWSNRFDENVINEKKTK